MREPQRRESGITRRTHLRDHLRDAFGEVEARRELRVDKQTNFHDGLVPPLAVRSILPINQACPSRTPPWRCVDIDNIAITCYYAIRIPRDTGEGLSTSCGRFN